MKRNPGRGPLAGRRGRVLVALAALVLLGLPGSAWSSSKLGLRFADGRLGPALPLQRLEDTSDESYVPASPLCTALDLDTFWRPETRKLVIKVADRRIQVTVDTRLVLDGSDEVLLRVPVHYAQGTVMLPLEFVERVLAPALGPTARLDRERSELVLGPANSDVLGIEYAETMDGTEVRVRLAKQLGYRVQATSDEVVRIALGDGRVDPVAIAADKPAKLVRNVRAEQLGKNAAIYLTVVPPLGSLSSRDEDDGRTVVVMLHPGQAQAAEPESETHVRPMVEMPTAAADSFDLVAVDAGHGGVDAGVEMGGRVEKTVTLDLASRVKPILERELGVHVLLLRTDDVTLSAQSRAEIANRAGADVLLTLHCNASFGSKARGFEVLYPRQQQSSRGDAALASIRSGIADFNPWDTSYLPHTERSATLAGFLEAELGRQLGTPDRGGRPAPVELLLASGMPSAQIEVGFLSDREEAATIDTAEFGDRLGMAIAEALRRYWAQVRGGSGKAAPPVARPGN